MTIGIGVSRRLYNKIDNESQLIIVNAIRCIYEIVCEPESLVWQKRLLSSELQYNNIEILPMTTYAKDRRQQFKSTDEGAQKYTFAR